MDGMTALTELSEWLHSHCHCPISGWFNWSWIHSHMTHTTTRTHVRTDTPAAREDGNR